MDLLTIREAADWLRLHPKSLYRMAQAGRIDHVRDGRRILFERAKVRERIERGRIQSLFEFKQPLISLEAFDKTFLRGGQKTVRGKAQRWNYGFGTIFVRKTKRGKDRWCINFRGSGGERRREVIKDAQSRGEAVVALQQKVGEVFDGKYHPIRKSSPITFIHLAEMYLEDYAKANKRSWRTDGSYLKAMKEYFGARPVDEITAFDLEKYKTRRLEEGVKKSTVNRCLAILRRMFNLAIAWGHMKENPMKGVRLFSEKDNLKERILTPEEEVRLLETCAPHLREIILVAVNSGMRRGEILGLRWQDVDFDNRILKVERSKSGKQRFIEMNSAVVGLLRQRRIKNPGPGYVFLNPNTGRAFVDVKTGFIAACRRAGIKDLRFHDLRHTFATRLIEAGVDIVTVRDLLGHSSVRLTERYTHSKSELKRRAVEALTAKKPEILSRGWHAEEKGDGCPDVSFRYSMN
jgi:excisionase family DNA binding protein